MSKPEFQDAIVYRYSQVLPPTAGVCNLLLTPKGI